MANNFLKSLIKINKRGNVTKGDYQTGLFGGGTSPAQLASAQAAAQRAAQRASERAQQRADAQANQRAAQQRASQARASQQNTSSSNPGSTMQPPKQYPNPISTSTPSPYTPIKVRKPRPQPKPQLRPSKPIPEPDLPNKIQVPNFRTTNQTPNYMTQYNNSINPKANTQVAYAAEPMQSRINNQYYATRNNGAFNENGFQQFMQQAQQQQAQPQPQYAQPQPVNGPDMTAQPQPVNGPDMTAQPVEDNRLARPMFGGTTKRMSKVKKSSKKPMIMKTYEYSPQRMHEGTGKPPKLPSTNRTIYSTNKFS